MQTQIDVHARVSPAAAPRPRLSLSALARLESDALEHLFGAADAFPAESLRGHPRGRVLAIAGRDHGIVAALLREMHALPRYPWEGKSFAFRAGAAEGTGINRVRLGFVRRGLFPFRTYATKSVVDGKPCLAIDYEVPQNPARVRPIYDELRRLDEGLYLGRGMRRRQGRSPKLILWFALDANLPDRPVAL